MFSLTKQEEELVREFRANVKIDRAYNMGIEFVAQTAEQWSKEGGGVMILDNLARSVRLRMRPERTSL